MRVVVTGASGNVGISLLNRLIADDRVTEVVGLARRRPDWAKTDVQWLSRDLATDDVSADLAGADAVIHLAWAIQPGRDERLLHRINVGGSAMLWRAAARAEVATVIHASSIGAYSPRQDHSPVAETWPTDGIPTSGYSRQKAYVERQLDAFELANPDCRVVRLRPGLIFQDQAGTEIHRYFLGRLVPRTLLRPRRLPVVPDDGLIRFQAVHSDDVADAYVAALFSDASGAFNVADEEVLDLPALADMFGARTVRVPPSVMRGLAASTFAARLQPTPPGWVDMAQQVPAMDIGRAHRELGWRPRRSARGALLELIGGMQQGKAGPTPPLEDGPPG